MCWPPGRFPNRTARGGFDGSPSGPASLSLKPDGRHKRRLKPGSLSLEEMPLGLVQAPFPAHFLRRPSTLSPILAARQECGVHRAGILRSPAHPRRGRGREDGESTRSGIGPPQAFRDDSRSLICLDNAGSFGYSLSVIFPGGIRLLSRCCESGAKSLFEGEID